MMMITYHIFFGPSHPYTGFHSYPNMMNSHVSSDDDVSMPDSVSDTGSNPGLPSDVSDRGSDPGLLPDQSVFDGGSDTDLPPDIHEHEDWKDPSEFDLDIELFLPSDIEELGPDSIEPEVEPAPPKRKTQAVTAKEPAGPGPAVASPSTVENWLRAPGAWNKLSWGMELYSVPRVLASVMMAFAANPPFGCLSLDILTGWDFDDESLRSLTFRILELGVIAFLFLSPPCTMFSELQRLWNQKKIPPQMWTIRWNTAVQYMEHSVRCAMIQLSRGKKFMLEHPWRASSWKLPCMQMLLAQPSVLAVTFDQCQCGLRSPSGMFVKKRTRIVTNSKSLFKKLYTKQCPKDHVHREIQGSEMGHSMSRWCQHYPEGLVTILASCLADP